MLERGGDRDERGGEKGEGSVDDEPTIRPSQIDTSILLSQNTIEQMFGASDDSEAEPSQTIVARAFGLFFRDLYGDEEQRDAAACFHMLSEASGLEGEGEDDSAVTPPTAPPRQTRTQVKPNTDMNLLQDGERSSEYVEFSSDSSDSVGICDDDRDSERDEVYEGDELSDSDVGVMDQAFLASLHLGGDDLLSKAVAMRRVEWFSVLQNQLLQLKAEDFAEVLATPPPSSQKPSVVPSTTPSNTVRREYRGVAKTCFEVWHDDFSAGQDIPANLGKCVVLRRPDKNTEQRKKTRRELQLPREEGSDGGDADNDSNGE
ncbi:unnamed protein product [Phytophthora fragariaefolia]|uniref:Unnamed protein product n=1 Tax=Phytophthora fragariaefolia TaxID=1490495 RepID=A0A9W6UEG9_9STRA|nr:unnamed protein product [Phytophthora fragariaefolia]